MQTHLPGPFPRGLCASGAQGTQSLSTRVYHCGRGWPALHESVSECLAVCEEYVDISGDMRLGEWVLKGLSECVSKSRRVLSPLPPTLILKAQVKPPPFMLVPDLPLHPTPRPVCQHRTLASLAFFGCGLPDLEGIFFLECQFSQTSSRRGYMNILVPWSTISVHLLRSTAPPSSSQSGA